MTVLSAVVATCGAAAGGVVDARTGFIPNRISAVTAVIAFGCAAAAGSATSALAGALTTGCALGALYAATRGRGIGLGDVKLGVAIGAGFGPADGIAAIGAAFVLGGAYAMWRLATRRSRLGDVIRFGPFLAAGSFAVVVALSAARTLNPTALLSWTAS
ncbi:MAG: hypothetical protein NVS3B7_11240 [Candidatus Elarobacter sp.]